MTLGSSKETWDALQGLKDKKTTEKLLHSFYLSALQGGIIEYFELESVGVNDITIAWCDLQMFITELRECGMITDVEEIELMKFINKLYLNTIDKYTKKGGKPNGESKGRCDVNSGRNTSRNGFRGTRESENNE